MKKTVIGALKNLGINVSRYSIRSNSQARLKHIVRKLEIDLILDVGANEGQTGIEMLNEYKFAGSIHSFEPTSAAYRTLAKVARRYPNWHVHNLALGDFDGQTEINIAGNSQSSSILQMDPLHVAASPASTNVNREKIEVRKLDGLISGIKGTAGRILLKCDTQGFEINVLEGAKHCLHEMSLVKLEMSTAELYVGSPLIGDVVRYMYDREYELFDVSSGFTDPRNGRVLQCDGLFIRKDLVDIN
jgi:FkbM family methyltransferase